MAYPTLADLVVRDDDLYVVTIQNPSTHNVYKALGQLESIDSNENYQDRQHSRVSTGTARKAGDRSTEVTMRLYVDDDLEEVALLLGAMKPGGGWAGSESLSLNPETLLQIRIDGYDGTGASASLVQRHSIANFSGRSLRLNISAQNPTLVELRGVTDALGGDPAPPQLDTTTVVIDNTTLTAGAHPATYIDVSGFEMFEFFLELGATDDAVTLQVVQATDGAGTGSKAVSGATVALTATDDNEDAVVEVQASDLDSGGGFDFVSCQLTVPGTSVGTLTFYGYTAT